MNAAKVTLTSTILAAALGLALGLMATPAQAHTDDPCPHKDLNHKHCTGGGDPGGGGGGFFNCHEVYDAPTCLAVGGTDPCVMQRAPEGGSPELALTGDCQTAETIFLEDEGVDDNGNVFGSRFNGNGFTMHVVNGVGGVFGGSAVFANGINDRSSIENVNVSIDSASATGCSDGTLRSVVSFNGDGLARFRIVNVEVSVVPDRGPVCDALEIVDAGLGKIKQTILNVGTFARAGIRMADIEANNEITRNMVHAGSTATAILVERTVGILIKHNTVTGGAIGVHVAADSTETTIANNVLTGLGGSVTGIVDDDVTCTTFIQNNNTITGYVTSVEQPNNCQ